MVRDRCNCYFSLWVIFCPLNPKNQILKKWKKLMEIASFYTSVGIASFNTSVPQIMIICYTLPEIWHMTDVTVIFHFGLFFALLPPTSPKNENFKKKWKKGLEISSFYTCTPKIMISWCTVPEIWCVTDRYMDGKSDIWRWMPHLKRGKKGKIFEDLGKNVQNLKILWKRAGNCMQ